MRIIKNNFLKNILSVIIYLIISGGFAARILFSLPFFYEQKNKEKILILLILTSIFLVLVKFFTRVIIFPHLSEFQNKSNKIFFIFMTSILVVTLALGSANYWAVPEVHHVQICFDANDETSDLLIEGLIDPNTNRLYPPDSFSFSRYPIILKSGNCLNGRITMLISKLTQALIGFRLIVRVQDSPPDGRFFVSINDVPAVVYFDHDVKPNLTNEIIFKEGFEKGEKINMPWGKHWFMGVKAMAILSCATYLSLFLFGFSEQILTFQSKTETRLDG